MTWWLKQWMGLMKPEHLKLIGILWRRPFFILDIFQECSALPIVDYECNEKWFQIVKIEACLDFFVSFLYFQKTLRKVCSNILTTLLFLNSTVNTRCVWRENLTDMFNHKASSIFVAHIFRRSKNLVLVPTIVVIVWFANQTFWMPYVELIEWYNIYLQMWWIEKI